jgi:hypothetical protein
MVHRENQKKDETFHFPVLNSWMFSLEGSSMKKYVTYSMRPYPRNTAPVTGSKEESDLHAGQSEWRGGGGGEEGRGTGMLPG